MKKYILLTTLLLLILGTSCSESFLDENPKSFESTKGTYTSTAGFNAALNGLMSYARLEFQTWTDGVIAQGACPQEVLQVGLDVCYVAYGDASLLPFENYKNYSGATNYVKNKWKWAYGMIANANLMVNSAESSAVNWDAANDKLFFQANARFFRAYAYRTLIYLWGDVPWVTEINDEYRTDFERTPKAEVMKNMIDDLEFAAKYLPENPAKVKAGQLTKWAALHLLSEICIYAGNYTRAVSAAQEVIASPYHDLIKARFGVAKDQAGDLYSDMFKEKNHNYEGGNVESIWVIQDEYNVPGSGKGYNDWSRRAWVPAYYGVKGFTISAEYGGRGLGQIRPSDNFYASLEANDIRNSEYNIRRKWYYNNPSFPELYGQLHTITEDNINSGKLFPAITKFDYGVSDPQWAGNNKDKTRFRLAETYLLLAEAYICQKDIPNATGAINEVRKRAGATLAQESEVDMDYLLDERSRELIGEEMRRFTLVRTGKLIERTKKHNPMSASKIEDKHALWPIPQDVMDANSGVKWVDNW